MKVKLMIILIFTSSFAICQTPTIQIIDSGSTDGFYKMFETLDTNYITTKILYDKVLPFVNVFKFDGVDSIGIATIGEWRQIYFEMYKGAVNNSFLHGLDSVTKKVNELYSEQGIIPKYIRPVRSYSKIF